MNVLVLNSGSSSIKYQLLDVDDTVRAVGLVEGIGEPSSVATHTLVASDGTEDRRVEDAALPDHAAGFATIVAALEGTGLADDLDAIGHRVVHGGAAFSAPTVIDDEVVARITEQVPLAPLHNPANLTGIEVARALRGDIPQVAVFDTAFHASLPEHAWRYAIDREVADAHGIRRYGFHGTSHAYVARRAAAFLGRPIEDCKLITCHLGNGASMTAIDGGRSVETSMGLSPLEGLVMGTRSGDVDPAVVFHLIRQAGMDVDEVDALLNRRSGLKGLCGENDLRRIEARAEQGDGAAAVALDVHAHRIRRYLGAYVAVLGGLDALVFTAGVGENADRVRARVCAGLDVLGIRLDEEANAGLRAGQTSDGIAAVQVHDAPVAILVIAPPPGPGRAPPTRAGRGGGGAARGPPRGRPGPPRPGGYRGHPHRRGAGDRDPNARGAAGRRGSLRHPRGRRPGPVSWPSVPGAAAARRGRSRSATATRRARTGRRAATPGRPRAARPRWPRRSRAPAWSRRRRTGRTR
ncbi:MAG: acetate kinase [Nitriliruptoraceae bacterium]|nr:acetate kinase [Nitriliruptoraceae bacterium]